MSSIDSTLLWFIAGMTSISTVLGSINTIYMFWLNIGKKVVKLNGKKTE